MAEVVYLRRKQKKTVETDNLNLVNFPLFRLVYEKIKALKDDIYNRKVDFLYQNVYRCYYAQLAPAATDGIDIPLFIYEEQRKRRASDEAKKDVLNVIRNGKVDECYRACLKALNEG